MALTGAKKTNVSWWKRDNKFPARTFVLISNALRDCGFTADRSLWGQIAETEAAE
jgi:hypothetical protein